MAIAGLSRRTIACSLLGGVVHAILALQLSGFVRHGSIGVPVPPDTLSGLVWGSSTVLGLVLLGAIPIALGFRYGLLTPLAALVLLFLGAFYGSYHHFEDARVTGVTSIDLYYDSLFGVLWFVALAVVLLFGLLEYALRRHLGAVSDGLAS